MTVLDKKDQKEILEQLIINRYLQASPKPVEFVTLLEGLEEAQKKQAMQIFSPGVFAGKNKDARRIEKLVKKASETGKAATEPAGITEIHGRGKIKNPDVGFVRGHNVADILRSLEVVDPEVPAVKRKRTSDSVEEKDTDAKRGWPPLAPKKDSTMTPTN